MLSIDEFRSISQVLNYVSVPKSPPFPDPLNFSINLAHLKLTEDYSGGSLGVVAKRTHDNRLASRPSSGTRLPPEILFQVGWFH